MIDFERQLDFQKHVIVYSQTVKPYQYLIRTLKSFGLQADDVMKYFANLIQRSIL